MLTEMKTYFFHFSIKTSKCSGSCNNINEPYATLCVPGAVRNSNAEVFNLMSRTNKTRQTEWHETCKCKCRLDASVCNNKQRSNDDKYKCECNKFIDKGSCDQEFIWNPKTLNVNAINHMMLASFYIIKNVSAEKK